MFLIGPFPPCNGVSGLPVARTSGANRIRPACRYAADAGGQNVNKVSTAVQLRFDVGQSRLLRDDVRQRLLAMAGNRATQEGVLIITSRVHRTQEANRAEARARLDELIARAQVAPKTRRPSRPTLGSKVRRLTAKSQRSASKKLRGPTNDD